MMQNANGTTYLHCSPSADAAFGPAVEGCRNNFDFTLTFEQYFFSVVPSILFLIIASLRVEFLRKKKNLVHGKSLRFIKLITIGVFAAIQLSSVILWATQSTSAIRVPSAIASGLSFLATVVLCALSYLEHSKSLRPSILLNAYLFISFLFDAVMLRTLWLTQLSHGVRDLFTASFALKAVILFLEAKEKREHIRSGSHASPEETSGLYNLSFLWWLNSIIRQGYRHVLRPTDLYHISDEMSSELLNLRFWVEWNKVARVKQPSLTGVLIRLLKWPLLVPVIPRLALLGFTFCQPLLVSRLLEFLQHTNTMESANIGYGLIGAYAVVYFGMSISNSLYSHRSYKCLTMLRGTLVAAIYSKTTDISITAVDNSAAVTLMSTDVERLVRGLRGMHNLWADVLQFVMATWLLESKVGWACIAPIIVTAMTSALTIILSSKTNKFQMNWIAMVQKRIGITSKMLGHMKGIKISGLTEKMTDSIQHLRVEEIKYAEKFWLLGAYTSTLAQVPVMVSPVLTFAIFAVVAAKDNTILDAPTLFSSLSLLILLTQPLFSLYGDIVEFRSTFGCLQRIEKFLVSETRSDHRLRSLTSPNDSQSFEERPLATSGNSQNVSDIELVPLAPSSTYTDDRYSNVDVARVENGTFGWVRDGPPILQDINFTIKRSQLTLLIGPVASGKSTLLKALLGETPSSKGFVYVWRMNAAYSDQTPWLINATVQQNIIGCSIFNQELYKAVLYSCDLERDIASFPDGDQTRIGSKGISLSSGQKQRVAIARAVYSKKDFVIFDDVFSGLDATTQKNVFSRLFGPQGLFRQWKTTVVIATHTVNLLPMSDRIIALTNDGRIAEQGTFQELSASNGYVQTVCLEHANNFSAADAFGEDETTSKTSYSFGKKESVSSPAISEDRTRQLGDWSVYRYYFRVIGWGFTITFLVLEVAWAFFSTFPTIWLKWYADSNDFQSHLQTGYYLGVYAALQVVGLLGFGIMVWFSFNTMAKKSGLRLHQLTLQSVMSAPMSFFSKTDTGSITTRFSQDMQLLDSSLPLAVMCVAANLLVCFAQMGLIASAAYYVAISFPVLIAVYCFIVRYYLRTSRQMRFLDLEEKAPVYTQFIESLSGLATIRAFGWQRASIEQNHELVDKSQKPFYLMYMIQTWLTLVLDLITAALAVLVVSIAVRMRETISVGFTGVSLTQIISFTANLRLGILFWTQMETSIGAVARIKQFTTETADENLPIENQEPPTDWPSRGQVEIEKVVASYSADAEKNALDNVSLSIRPGQKIGVCGRTGSGKSTLTLALFRMIEFSSGKITIDGLDISTIPRHYIRTRLNAMGEDPYFLNGTIRLNLDPYDDSDDEHLQEVLEKVQLWETIQRKGGLDADFGDDTLSHGQKQLFCLARAMLRPGMIVVMDEVTSSVDKETDELMQKLIRTEFRDQTVITIAHRVDTIIDYDYVVVMDEGRLAEFDSPTILLAKDSMFKSLFDASKSSGKGKERVAG